MKLNGEGTTGLFILRCVAKLLNCVQNCINLFAVALANVYAS